MKYFYFRIIVILTLFQILKFEFVQADELENNLNIVDSNGITSLMSAVAINDLESVKFFSRDGKYVVNKRNLGGATSLHIAARNGNLDIVKILIQASANVNLSDNEGYTPLMRVAIANNHEVFSLLLKSGANPFSINSFGETAIFHAANSDCIKCLETSLQFIKNSSANSDNNLDSKLLINQLNKSAYAAYSRDNKEVKALLDRYIKDLDDEERKSIAKNQSKKNVKPEEDEDEDEDENENQQNDPKEQKKEQIAKAKTEQYSNSDANNANKSEEKILSKEEGVSNNSAKKYKLINKEAEYEDNIVGNNSSFSEVGNIGKKKFKFIAGESSKNNPMPAIISEKKSIKIKEKQSFVEKDESLAARKNAKPQEEKSVLINVN